MDANFIIKFKQLKDTINAMRDKDERLSDGAISGIMKRIGIKHDRNAKERFFYSNENQIKRLTAKYCITEEHKEQIAVRSFNSNLTIIT